MSKENVAASAPVHRLVVGQFRDNGLIHYLAHSVDEHLYSVTLVIDEVVCWHADDSPSDPYEEVAVFDVKWDGCAHIGFRSPDLGKNWVHVCGIENMRRTLRMMEWAWDLAVSILRERGFDDDDLAAIRLPNGESEARYG